MHLIVELAQRYGLGLVFVTVLIEQIGLPIPSYPILIVTAALSTQGNFGVPQVIASAVVACLLADFAWFRAGARFGGRVLGLMCRLSLSPDSCVRQTESIYERWGAPSLLVAKFVPGFGAVATAMAGVVGVSPLAFVFFDTIGATIWTGLAAMLGWIFRNAVDDILQVIESAGRLGVAAIIAALGIYLLVKFAQRQRLLRQLRMARVSVDELDSMLKTELPPLLIDVRSAVSREGGFIPGSLWVEPRAPDEELRSLPSSDEVVVYCACPNEASAAVVAKRLMKAGFRRVRPLQGGIDAWIASGLPVQTPVAQ
ncbi:MAG TPA: DedA family protein/thiosulfate sulfurtransferase GlpE [Burkholderiaceae bacterium]|nr:DedA family protein/thiosulfate sulfurtransferase GlpE [Burkholderiaceae bacterium]